MASVDDFVNDNSANLWTFPVKEGCDFENAFHIHPLKQCDAKRFVDDIRNDSDINGVIAFGSAVRFDCNSGSDLDLLIVRKDDKKDIRADITDVDGELDLIFSSGVGDRLKDEIKATGVVIYRRQTDV